jgi:acyl-CoA thioesterase I
MRIRVAGALRGLVVLMLLTGSAACEEGGDSAPVIENPPATEVGDPGEVEPPGAPEGSSTPNRPDATTTGAERPLIVAMGTSLTEGYGLADPERQAWPALLEREARSHGIDVTVRNAGLSGETSAGARRRVGWILDRPPDLFILETGANDGLRGLDPQAMEENIDAIFGEVRSIAPEARLVLAGMEAPPNLGTSYVESFREVFPRAARRWDAILIPFFLEGVAGEPSLNQPDGIHPTAEGHRIMSEEVWRILRPVIEDPTGRRP